MSMLYRDERGITITELAIAVFMAGLVAVLVGGITVTFYGAVLRQQLQARMVVDSQIILRDIVDELRVAARVIQDSNKADPYAPPGGWSTDSSNAILIIETPVIASDGSFLQNPDTGEPFMNELIYFAEDDTMYRRALIDTSAPENDRIQTCPAANVGVGICSAQDSKLSEDYDVMTFDFFDQDNNLTSDTSLARSIDMSVVLSRSAFRATTEIENNIRVTLRN